MARPSFTIDGQRLKGLRKEADKTPLAIAKEVREKLGIKYASTDATLRGGYTRIERTGRTSKQYAEALSEIFGVSLEELQGKGIPKPFDYLGKVASLLHERFSSGASEALIHALKEISDTQEPSDESIRRLAEHIAARIETVQLGRNPSELAKLTEVTGLPESELLKPANVYGHWLLIANGLGVHCTEFVRGAINLAWRVREIVGNRLDFRGSDGSIRMFSDEPWFRLEIRPWGFPEDVIRIDFVRCDTSQGTGIRWTQATWRDRFEFEDSFRTWAYSTANFVTDFEGRQSPAGDVRRLRLLVTEYDRGTYRPTGRLVVSGDLNEMDDEIVERFRQENSTHAVVQNWLTVDLKRTLAPFLADHPPECWKVSHGLTIDLDEHKARKRPIQDCHFGTKYSIRLVEEVGENEFSPVPWREKDTKRLQEDIEKMLGDPDDWAWTTDEPRRSFVPYSAEA